MAEWFAQCFAMLLTLCFTSTLTKMLLECECQELIVLDRQEILLLFTSHVPQLTQQDFFMNRIVLGNEYVQQRIVVQNKKTETIIYYESIYYNRSRLFLESTRTKGRVINFKERNQEDNS